MHANTKEDSSRRSITVTNETFYLDKRQALRSAAKLSGAWGRGKADQGGVYGAASNGESGKGSMLLRNVIRAKEKVGKQDGT
eukprot:763192-Hanusia_phi.AAC.1